MRVRERGKFRAVIWTMPGATKTAAEWPRRPSPLRQP